jgi:hypothetical protein
MIYNEIAAGVVAAATFIALASRSSARVRCWRSMCSIANLIVAEQAAKLGIKLTFMEYLRAGVLITILTLIVAVVWLQIVT